jgi:hypothetical protein
LHQDENPVHPIDRPAHYCVNGYECIDIIEALGLNYRLGNALKYIWRANLKGNRLQDLKKAAWYIDREIARMEAKAND